jgi:hypothetical protein
MAEGDRPFAGTQIGSDGKRYDTGDQPTTRETPKTTYQVFGTPSPGDIVWWNPDTERLEFTDFDTASAYVPSSS